jgi:hypothetical protein
LGTPLCRTRRLLFSSQDGCLRAFQSEQNMPAKQASLEPVIRVLEMSKEHPEKLNSATLRVPELIRV